MRTKQLFLMLALLCAVVQGAWAQNYKVWDGSTTTKPQFYSSYAGHANVVVINTGAELAYIRDNWTSNSGDWDNREYYKMRFLLNADLDMSATSWIPFGNNNGDITDFEGWFNGNAHTIRIKITNAVHNYQGLFARVKWGGTVKDLHLTGSISCSRSRLVGGICGENYGDVTGCWVSASVYSAWKESSSSFTAKVGGIAGENAIYETSNGWQYGTISYCCVTNDVVNDDQDVGGIVGFNDKYSEVYHCTFYGSVMGKNADDQDNKWIGDNSGEMNNMHDSDLNDDATLSSYLSSISGHSVYRYAIQNPYAVTVVNVGNGAVSADPTTFRYNKTVRVNVAHGSLQSITGQNESGSNVPISGNPTSGYTVNTTYKDVTITAVFPKSDWQNHSGTQADPYLINSSSDWNEFANSVNYGTTYSGKYVKLGSDIEITTTAGNSETNSFQGTFLGNNKTLTANITNTDANNTGVAPFRYINGATIKNLTVAGTITSNAYHTSGLVGSAYGNNLIEGCTVTATLNINTNYASGFLGHGNKSMTTFKDCTFAGTFNGGSANRKNIGVFWGWSTDGYPRFQNCVENGTYIRVASMNPIGLNQNTGALTNCYYVNPQIGGPNYYNELGGTWQVSTTGEGRIYSTQLITGGDGKNYYMLCTVTGIESHYDVTSSGISITPTVKDINGSTLSFGSDYTAKLDGKDVTVPVIIHSKGNHTLTLTGIGSYGGSHSFGITVNFTISGGGTEDDPFIISNAADWNNFASSVNSGDTYSGRYVKLTNDISVETMVGTDYANSFQGTFDGGGHTLTVNYNTSENNTAPFRHVSNATIKNLRVAGTINTSAPFAGGIVSESHGALTLAGCVSSVAINSSRNGDSTHGGLVSTLSGANNNIIIEGCVFDGSFATTAGTVGCGGFIGWGVYNKPVIRNSLLKPSSVDANMLGSNFARWYTGDGGIYEPTFTNCGYVATNNLPTDQGSPVNEATEAYLGNPVQDYGFVKAYDYGILYNGTYYQTASAFTGTGEESNPYIINNTHQWNNFAYYVNNGLNNYSGKYVKLGNDIEITMAVGSSETNSFQGTFLGNNKTLTANITNTNNKNNGVAPFHTIKGATIKDLTVAGTISSNSSHTSGLVGYPYDTNLIENCVVTATLNLRSNYAGGLIGHGGNATVTLNNCAFVGTVNGVDASRSYFGAIWGWSTDATPILNNCLENGTYNDIGYRNPMGYQQSAGSVTNCYYVNPKNGNYKYDCTHPAQQVLTEIPDSAFVRLLRLADGNDYYIVKNTTITGVNENYDLEDGLVSITPTVTIEDETELIFNTDYKATLDGKEVTSWPITFNRRGNYTLVISGHHIPGNNGYGGSKTLEFTVGGSYDGTGAETDPFLIANNDEWREFAQNTKNGKTYSGKFVKLTANVDAMESTGLFCGTFDGNGKTITAAIDGGEAGASLFGSIDGATIKDLTVAGTISGGTNTAALVGSVGNSGTNLIVNSVVNATVTSSGDHMGGFLADASNGNITIKGCVFSGKMVGGNSTKGVFTGWAEAEGTVSVIDCLFLMQEGQSTDSLDLVKSNAGTITVTNSFKTTQTGKYGRPTTSASDATADLGELVQDYGMVKAYKNGILFGDTYYIATFIGTGTEDDPYIIGNEEEWIHFSFKVNNGNNYSGKFVKLTADIAVTDQCGIVSGYTRERAFSGTFLGDSHTITVTFDNDDNEALALFRYINGATIKDLKVAGSIASNQNHTSGLVGFAEGTNLIENCIVTATLNISSNYAGGLVGHGLDSNTTIRGSVFAGTFNGVGESRGNIGGIWGGTNNATPKLENCLEVGTYTNISSMHPMGLMKDKGTITNCYYMNPQVGEPINACTVSGYKRSYALTTAPANLGELVKGYGMVKAYKNGILYNGTYYIATSTGTGTEDDPYIIVNEDAWREFASKVNNGNNFSGKFVKLIADINVSSTAGYGSKTFSGTFLGDGHTITVTLNDDGSDDLALFRSINGATIKDLTVAGTITSNQDFASGLVGCAEGTNLIENCIVTATLNISSDIAGGLVGHGSDSNTTIRGCVFAGTFNGFMGEIRGHIGGIWGGTTYSTPTLENCLEAGTYNNINNMHPMGLMKDKGTITNCYYVNPQIGKPGNACTLSGYEQAYIFPTAPSNLGELVNDYGMVKVYNNGILYNGKYYIATSSSTGTGTETDPYIISNENDWIIFSSNVNNGNNYSGKFVKLTADIAVTNQCGTVSGSTRERAFSGTFLGNNHTITVTLDNDGNQGLAPFRYINGATIRDLTVAGTVTSGLNHTSGLVGYADGTNLIENCIVTATLNINSNIAGGFIGHGLNSNTTIRGCVFAGTFNGVGESEGDIGSIWGWSDNAAPTLENCLEAGTYTNITAMHPMGLMSNNGTITNCYYMNPQVGEPRKVCTVSGYERAYALTTAPDNLGELVQDYSMVKAYKNGILFSGTYYIATSSGTGTEDDPYIISNEDEWMSFTTNVKNGKTFSGKFVKLTADIAVTDQCGIVSGYTRERAFSGTFLGDGHTITVTFDNDDNEALALFRYINGATIKDLKVAGTVASDQNHTSGLVGFAEGTNLIENCIVTATLNINSNYAGGLVGHGLDSKTTIRGSVFAGTFNGVGESRGNIGGIWGGINNATPTLENCLEAGTYTNISSMHPMGLMSDKGTITNCYYVNPQVGEPRNVCTVSGYKEAYTLTVAPANLGELVQEYGMVKAYKNGILFGGTYYIVSLTGTGTETDPYIIGNEEDWIIFSTNVKNGKTYSGKFVKLTADIAVTDQCGIVSGSTRERAFSGTFLGDGHTITVTLDNDDNVALALFRYINGATIKGLTVAGTIASEQNHMSGLVGFADGTNLIENCIVTATLNVSSNYAGGLVGHGLNSNTTIRGCVFAGTFNGVGEGGGNIGSIWGWGDNAAPTLENCLEAGTYTNITAMHPMGLMKDKGTITNCYYVNQQVGEPRNACTVSGYKRAYTFSTAPADLGELVHDYGMVKAYKNGILFGGTYYIVTLAGTGTETDPYIIGNEEDWIIFSTNVKNGNTYSGKFVKLIADINVSSTAGYRVSDTDNKPFSGTFLGDSHTITVTLDNDDSQGLALFRYINGATIRNLTVAGTVASDQNHTSGLVGFADGTNLIENCIVTATLNVSSNYAGGFVGHGLDSNTTIRGSVFAGTFNGVGEGGGNIGGIWGWGNNAAPTLENCLEAGTYTNITAMHPMGLQGNKGTITNCYYVNPQVGEPRNACTVSGYKHVYGFTTAPANLGELVKDYGMVKVYKNGILFGDTYYVATFTGTGTETDPYIIGNEDDWMFFSSKVNNGNNFSGKFVKLTADINVSSMAGYRVSNTDNKPFSGIFLGDGHTITVTLDNDDNAALALFRYINGATIKGLTVAGTIASEQNHMSGLVGFADGTNLIENCIVTATLNVSGNYAGGLVGHGLNSNTTIRGSVFAGTFNGVGEGGGNIGSIWGWGDNAAPTLENCLEAGTYTNITAMHPMGLQGNKGTITNCYYVNPQVGEPRNACTILDERQAYTLTTAPDNLGALVQDYGAMKVYNNGILFGGTYYIATFSGTGTEDDPYIISNEDAWREFVSNVKNGHTYNGKFVKLTADIAVTDQCGIVSGYTRERAFSGTFLGDNHTITVTLDNDDNEALALFRYINGATIKDLKVAGTVASSQNHTSGLVGFAEGTNLIEDCIVTATLNINSNYAGGLVGHGLDSKTTIRGSVFAGTFNGVGESRDNIGGIWGGTNIATPKLENCVEAGTYTNISSMHPMGLMKDNGTITNCYYVNPQVGEPRNVCTVSGYERAYALTAAPANLGELVKGYGMVKVYENGILSDGTYYVVPTTITLTDNGDNSTTIGDADNYVASVTLQGRTFYRDGSWNTLCLPFSVDDFTGTPLEGATVKTLASTTFAGGTLTMNFSEAESSIEAGKPYIVKWPADSDIENPVFNGVTISDVTANAETDYVDYVGTYNSVGIYTDEKTKLYLGVDNTPYVGVDNKLHCPISAAFLLNTCRGYFQLKQGLTAGEPTSDQQIAVNNFVINFGEDEVGIISVEYGNLTNGNEADTWYTLDGRKLVGKPTLRGVYIYNGNKVAIK